MRQTIAKLLARITFRRRRGADRAADEPRQAGLPAATTPAVQEPRPGAEGSFDAFVGFAHTDQAKQAEPLYMRMLADAERRHGPEHSATLKAKANLATVYAFQGRFDEAASLAEQLLPFLIRRLGVQQDQEVTTTIGNLILWYRNAGRSAEAATLERAYWQHLPVCAHLKPLEDYLLMAGAEMTGRGRWGGVTVSFDANLDLEALQQRLHLAPCLEVAEMADPHYGYARGFSCALHHDAIMGRHPSENVAGPTIA